MSAVTATGAHGTRVARWLRAAEDRPVAIALGAGALSALALPPVDFWPALLAFAPLLHLLRRAASPQRGFLLGWAFGFSHFLAGLYWIAIAFFTDAERFGALAVPAVLLLCAGLALLPALAALAAALRTWRSPLAAVLAFALAWVAAEGLRSVLFGGFPWNLAGYAWSATPVAQLAALTGVHGLSWLAVALGALPAVLLAPGGRSRFLWVGLGIALLGLAWGGGAWRLAGAPDATVPEVRLRLVQGNVAQHHKWDPELRARWFRRHLDLSARERDGVTHVIWPESATPYAIADEPTARAMIAGVTPPGGLVLTGGERFDLEATPPRAWNSLFVLDGDGAIVSRYDKHHLVPFGEFLPLRGLLGRLGLETLTRGSIDFLPGPGPTTLALPGLPPVSPLICYEVIFSGRVAPADARPDWLLNITNDAWFGTSSGPYQHLAMARMRAIEEGLPLVRAANTGISAVIDPLGRIEAQLDLNVTGVLDSPLPAPLEAPPPFVRWRWLPLAFWLVASGLIVVLLEGRRAPARAKVNKS